MGSVYIVWWRVTLAYKYNLYFIRTLLTEHFKIGDVHHDLESRARLATL